MSNEKENDQLARESMRLYLINAFNRIFKDFAQHQRFIDLRTEFFAEMTAVLGNEIQKESKIKRDPFLDPFDIHNKKEN